MRTSMTLFLKLTTLAPLSHGEGNEGNEQILRTETAFGRDGEEFEHPFISGAAIRATLRENAVWHMAESLDLPDGSMSMDAIRLLAKGGKNDKGGPSISLAEMRKLRQMFPLLAVFGSMDAGIPIKGQLSVGDAIPITRETIDAGFIPRTLRPATLTVDGEAKVVGETDEPVALYDGVAPISLHQIMGRSRQYYRHDISTSSMTPLIASQDQAALEEHRGEVSTKKAARKAGDKSIARASTEERREANESMPHAYQVVPRGVSFALKIEIGNALPEEIGVLAAALRRWIQQGAHLGGAAAKGHGAMAVDIAGGIRYALPSGAAPALGPGELIQYNAKAETTDAESAYLAKMQANREAIMAHLSTATR